MFKRSKLGIYTSLIISSTIVGSIVGGGIAYPTISANVDKLELLNRAVENDSVKALARARGDIMIATNTGNGDHYGAYIGNRLYMWGNNASGQLGLGDTSSRSTPTWVTRVTGNVTQLVTGNSHTGAIINGVVYTWGSNGNGQLGRSGNQYIPDSIGWNANKLAFGSYHSGLISTSGKIYMWGYNVEWSSCGVGHRNNDITYPTAVSTKSLPSNYYATDLTLGFRHSGAIINGKLYTWGGNNKGQLGYSASPYEQRDYPYEVKDINEKGTPTSISFGSQISGAIVGGRVYTWGDNNWGQLGIGKNSNWEWVTLVTRISGVTKLQMNDNTTMALAGGYLYAWGRNSNGQIGVGSSADYNYPTTVSGFSYNTITQISGGRTFSIAIENGQLYVWGYIYGTSTYSRQKITITESQTINLSSSNDPHKIRDEVVYNLTNNDMINIIEPSNSSMNLPMVGTYGLYSQVKIGSTPYNGSRTGRLSLTVSSNQFPVQTNITFYGLKPVNLTQSIQLDPKVLPADDKIILGLSPDELVNEANADSTGTDSKLAQWIIANASLFTESESRYTVNFPANAKITKVDTFEFTDWKKGEITFNIYVDKYYKQSGQDYILSTSSDAPIKITKKITLSGLTSVISLEDCVDGTNKIKILETEIEPQTTVDKFFLAVADNIDGSDVVNQTLLREYIDIRFIPPNAIINIKRLPTPDANGRELVRFKLTTDKHYKTGKLITTPFEQDVEFVIRPKTSEILVIENNHVVTSQITTGDALALMKEKNDAINYAQASKYLNFKNFPLNTIYNFIPGSIINENEKGILTLSINANQYYDLSSVHAVYKNKAFNAIEITGFKPSYDLSKYPLLANSNEFQSFSSANTFYSEVINENSGTVNRDLLANYVDLKAIPDDAKLSITRVEYNENDVIKFIVKTNKYYDQNGTTINQDHEQEIFVKLPKFDWMFIVYICIGALFLIVIITCIIISIRNKRSVKYGEVIKL